MATCRRILIKNVSKELIVESIKNNYLVGRMAIYDYEYREVLLDKLNYAFIVFDAYFKDWIEIDLYFNQSVEEHDDFLINISKTYNTIVIFGYKQTTTGDGRVLVLNNGQTIRNIYQKSYYEPHRILMECNIGNKSNYEKDFDYSQLGQSTHGKKSLDFYDDMQEMFKDYGYCGEGRKVFDEKYIHIEYLNENA